MGCMALEISAAWSSATQQKCDGFLPILFHVPVEGTASELGIIPFRPCPLVVQAASSGRHEGSISMV